MLEWYIKLLPVAVPGKVLKSTVTFWVVELSFTIWNLTTAPAASVTVYTTGLNCIVTAVRVHKMIAILIASILV